MKKGVVLFAVIVLLATITSACFSADIVTVPTANQLKQGEIDTAYYVISLDMGKGPDNVQVQTLYLGVTDRLEVDVHRYDIDMLGDSTIINASYSVLRETSILPDVVIGGRNIGQTSVGGNDPDRGISIQAPREDKTDDTSWFITTAKSFVMPADEGSNASVVRLHLGYGSADHTLLNVDRHDGLFGGVQILATPEVGLMALHDGEDVITGVAITPKNSKLTLKGGTFGDHSWIGASWAGKL